MIGIIISCLQILMAVSIHLNSWGNYYSLHPDLRCTTQRTITGAYYNAGVVSASMRAGNLQLARGSQKSDLPADTARKRRRCCDIGRAMYLLCLPIRKRKGVCLWGGSWMAILAFPNLLGSQINLTRLPFNQTESGGPNRVFKVMEPKSILMYATPERNKLNVQCSRYDTQTRHGGF